MVIKPLVAFLGLAIATSASAFAGGAVWHWEKFGAGGYSGIVEVDDGGTMDYRRYDASGSPALFGSTSVQSPVTVIAGADIQVDIVKAGLAQPRKECSDPADWKVYVTPATACSKGAGTAPHTAPQSMNLSGIHAWAAPTGDGLLTHYIPKLSVHVQGYGWLPVEDSECGLVQTLQLCE
ncbi:MAG: hypothetical protein ITG07_02770 [Candidimonas sp.]|nr:hypothetical protein [Candidimonas sp.]